MRLATVLPLLVLASTVHGARIDVSPGPGAIQAAVDAASPGDTLRVHAGTYEEAVVIGRPLRLVGDGAADVLIDAGCNASSALTVTADGVTIERVAVAGAQELTIDVEFRDDVVVRNTVTTETCGGAEYGINLYQSTNVRIVGNSASGFADAGIYLGGLAADAKVRALHNTSTGNTRGIIVENSSPGVVVRGNVFTDSAGDGIFLHNADGVVVARNVDVGQTVAASFQTPTLFLIAQDLTKMQVDTNVSESDIGDVNRDQPALFTVDAYPGTAFHGVVAQVRNAPITVQNVVTYDVVIAVDNPDLKLKPGMTATVTITTAERTNVLRIPLRALRFRPEHTQASPTGTPKPERSPTHEGPTVVWALAPDGTLRKAAVTTGVRNDQYAELQSGELHDGDQLVVAYRQARETGSRPPSFPGRRF